MNKQVFWYRLPSWGLKFKENFRNYGVSLEIFPKYASIVFHELILWQVWVESIQWWMLT